MTIAGYNYPGIQRSCQPFELHRATVPGVKLVLSSESSITQFARGVSTTSTCRSAISFTRS